MLLGRRLVVFRTLDGCPRVLPDRCLHRGGALHRGAVIGDSIECPHHGWRWRGADGHCVYIPSHGPPTPIPQASVIEAFPAVERYGLVWTCVGDPLTGPPHLPELESLGINCAASVPVDVEAGILTAMENFREVAHFPFVHRGTMGTVPHRETAFEVRREGYQTWMTRSYSATNGKAELFRNVDDLPFDYHTVAPGIAVLLDHGAGGKRIIMEAFTPVGPTSCRIFVVCGTATDSTAYDPAELLAAQMQLLPTFKPADPLVVPFQREQYEPPVEVDNYTLEIRRAFVEFVSDAGAMLKR
jgi:phenylpropionate dioxygenase-like ring-hydroxylating dioxygenase large terminal subunit